MANARPEGRPARYLRKGAGCPGQSDDGIRKDFTIYTIDVEGTTHTFAAIGRGLNTWLFYVGE